jgi:putative spermidine/putrescine transport system ATP-binding protein
MFVASFMGESYSVPVSVRDQTATIAGRPLLLPETPPPGSSHRLLLRPENLRVVRGDAAGLNLLHGRVRDVVFQGESVVSYVEIDGAVEVAVRHLSREMAQGRTPVPGTEVTLGLEPADTLILSDG